MKKKIKNAKHVKFQYNSKFQENPRIVYWFPFSKNIGSWKIFKKSFKNLLPQPPFPFWLLLPQKPKKTRRASRAGLLHFPMFLLLFDPKYPQNFPGALRAPDCFIFLCFCCVLTPNTPGNFPARFARRIA